MKKYLLFFGIFLFISGCSVNYELEIKDKTFNEQIEFYVTNDEFSTVKNSIKGNTYIDSLTGEKYQLDIKQKSNGMNITNNQVYKISEYKTSKFLKICFSSFNVIEEDLYYILSTSEGLMCYAEEDVMFFDDITIKIKTNHEVINSNADEVKDNVYYWYVNDENYNKKSINIKLSKDEYIENNRRLEKEVVEPILISITIVLLLAVLVVFMIFIKKRNNSNKI